MKLCELLAFDTSLNFLYRPSDDVESLGPTGLFDLKEGHFLFVKEAKYFKKIEENLSAHSLYSKMGIVFEKRFYDTLSDDKKDSVKKTFSFALTCQDLMFYMAKISKHFYDKNFKDYLDLSTPTEARKLVQEEGVKIDSSVSLGRDVTLGKDVVIYSGVRIMGGVSISDGTVIFPNVTIYPRVKIGKNCRIHAGTVIGADGFGYHFSEGEHKKIWHYGSVDIGDDVEIGACTCIDSGTFSATKVGNGTKIDNHVQVGHNVRIGSKVILCGKTGIAGSTQIGDYTVIGGSCAINNGIVIGKNCQIAGHSGVISDLEDSSIVGGYPARNIKQWMREIAWLKMNAQKK